MGWGGAMVLTACACALVGCGSKKRAPSDAAVGPDDATVARPADAGDPSPTPDASVATRPERAVFSLGDNLLTAHRLVGGDLAIDAGSIGFARYTRFDLPVARWRYRQTVLGQRVAVAAKGGSVELPLTEAQAAATTAIRLRLVAERSGRLAVRLGTRKLVTLELVAGRQWYEVATPPGAWHAGENLIVLDGAVAVDEVRLARTTTSAAAPGPAPADADADADADDFAHAAWDLSARTLTLDDGAGLAWYAHLPADAHVVADLADPACRVEVSARSDDGTRAGGVLGGGVRRVDLAAVGERAVRLELVARDCPRAILADPVVAVPGAPPTPPPAGPPARYVVLWIMDALRADRVRTFEPGARAEVPNFDRLAETSAVFRQYYVQGNESQTSHASLWTSTYPAVHNVRQAGDGGSWRLPRELPVLGELVAAAGLQPIAVTGNGFITSVAGYGRGFVEFRNLMRERMGDSHLIIGTLYGKDVLGYALTRMAAHQPEPHLLFLGTIDNHGPWIARKPWIDRYSPASYRGPFQKHGTMKELGIVRGQMGCSIVPPPDDIERLRAIYDSAISYQDERLGELVVALQQMGIYDQTMIIVTADHGEELFEDGRCGHGGSLRETLVRVPLLIHYPARIAPGVVEEGVEEVDVLPTLLDTIGAEVPASLQGAPLAPLTAGLGRGWARPSYASQFEYAHTMRVARWKLKVGKRGVPVAIDLVADPDERTDVSLAAPAARRLLTDALGLFLATRTTWHKRSLGVVTNLVPGAAALLEAP